MAIKLIRIGERVVYVPALPPPVPPPACYLNGLCTTLNTYVSAPSNNNGAEVWMNGPVVYITPEQWNQGPIGIQGQPSFVGFPPCFYAPEPPGNAGPWPPASCVF